MKWAMLFAFALSVCLVAVASDQPKLVQILKVLHDTEPQKRHSAMARSISPNEVGKFKELRDDFAVKPSGEYITILWKNCSPKALRDVTVTLSYRQTRVAEVQSGTIEMETVKRGTAVSEFRIIGDAYGQNGPVTAWRVDVAADGQPLDSFHSFLWKDPS